MKFWSYIFRGLLLIATRRHRQFVANSETPAVQNAPARICATIPISVNGPAQAPVEVEACTYFAANSETPAVRSSIPNGPYQAWECETVKYTNDPAQVTAAACLTMRELVQGIQHECTGSMSGGGEPGCKDETRAEKEAAYTVEQQRRLGVDETGKPIQEEGEAEDHSEVEEGEDDRIQEAKDDIQRRRYSEVTRRYPGIPREIKLDGVDNPCVKGVYYLTPEMFNDQSMWVRRDKCYGYTWIARAAAIDWRSFEDGRHEMEFGFVEFGFSGHHWERVLVSRWKQ